MHIRLVKSDREPVLSFLHALILSVVAVILFAGAALAVNAPTITPGTGVYTTEQSSVTITGDAGADLFLTTDGTVPSSASQPYTGPIPIGATAVIKAIAYVAGVPGPITTAYICNDPNALPVPQSGLSLWLRGDFGPIVTGAKVTQWIDLSGSTNNAAQATSTKQPTLVNPAINGYPAVKFNGTSQYLSLTSGLSDLTTGAAIFAIISPVGTATKTLVTSANAGPADMLSVQTINTQANLNAYDGITASSVTTATGALTLSKFQLLEAVHNGAASATLSVNAAPLITGTVQNLNNTTRTQNYVGADNTAATFWNGQLAELLVYSRTVTASEQAAIEGYLVSKYQVFTATTTPAPVISVPTSTLKAPTAVAISAGPASTVYFTIDGTAPVVGTSPIYSGPINIAYTSTLKAIAVANGVKSAVSTSVLTLNATQWPAPSAADNTLLQINLQLPTTAIPQ
jgi:hypothetical protein